MAERRSFPHHRRRRRLSQPSPIRSRRALDAREQSNNLYDNPPQSFLQTISLFKYPISSLEKNRRRKDRCWNQIDDLWPRECEELHLLKKKGKKTEEE